MSQAGLIMREPPSMNCPIFHWEGTLSNATYKGCCTTHKFLHNVQQIKSAQSSQSIEKIIMMMSKHYPTFLCKSHFSHIFPFSFFSIHLSQVDSVLFFCFMKFQTFWGSEGVFDCCFWKFLCGHFPTEYIHKLNQNHFFLLPFFCTIVLRSKVDHMRLVVAVK